MGLLYLFTSSNQAVLHTIRAEAANIKASYVSIKSMMMGCMESIGRLRLSSTWRKFHLETSLAINTML
jgi:hypothetical protein